MSSHTLGLPRGPFTRAQARQHGITDRQLCGPGFVRLHAGVYVAAGTPVSPQVRAAAALLIGPEGALVARHTAAALWGGIVPECARVHLVVPSGRRMRVEDVDARERRSSASVQHLTLAVTSPAQTFCDLAEDLSLVDMVVLGDSLVRRRRVTPVGLVEAARDYRGPGARLARRAAAYVRNGVDSPMETRVRMLLVLAGLPEPTVNVILRAADGQWRYRLDLTYPQWRLAIEYDGRQHAESADQWVHDVGRREWLDGHGWRLLVVLSGDVYASPGVLLDRVVGAIRERGGAVKVTSPEWAEHFRGRGTPPR